MKKQKLTRVPGALLLLAALSMPAGALGQRYRLQSVKRTQIRIDSRYDQHPDSAAMAFLTPYKLKVDSLMSPVMGTTTHYMTGHRPESDLSNLLSDILVWYGEQTGEHIDFGMYNIGGIRAALPKGKVTYGDILNVAPFENHITYLTLTGSKVLELFRQVAAVGGEGVSSSVRLVITADGKLNSATIGGKPVDANATYRIATIDYLAHGNDKMEAFKAGTRVVSPQEEKYDTRYIIAHYFQTMTAENKVIDTHVEGRITVEK